MQHHGTHERRTWSVVGLTAFMMVAEIVGGTLFGSIALVADGWHMATHVAALAIAGLAYLFPRARRQCRLGPSVVGMVDRHAGRNDLVDAVEHVVGEGRLGGGQLGFEVLHRPRADDRRGDRGVAYDKRDRHVDHEIPAPVGELGELLGGVELALVGEVATGRSGGEPGVPEDRVRYLGLSLR